MLILVVLTWMYVVMPRAYSLDLRIKIVAAYKNGAGTIPEIAELFGVSEKSVSRYILLERAGNDLSPKLPPGRTPILNAAALKELKFIVLESNDSRLQDYCLALKNKIGLDIAQSTLWDAIESLGLGRKKRVSMLLNENHKEYKTSETIS
jgi:transposase